MIVNVPRHGRDCKEPKWYHGKFYPEAEGPDWWKQWEDNLGLKPAKDSQSRIRRQCDLCGVSKYTLYLIFLM